ncbi:MAG: hypothetical protein HW380_3154 [Magnetococcales bacterium]|nr:hypothetical protein [Magnetococcales bacterium]HIJ84380.1 type II secretion system protein [Magnetococcales bacterium]
MFGENFRIETVRLPINQREAINKIWNKKKQGQAESGFSLLELILVIFIIGILTATLLPEYVDISILSKDVMSDKMRGDINSTLHSIHGLHLVQKASGTAINPPLVTNCSHILNLLDEIGDIACVNDTTLTFPNYRMSVLTPEVLFSRSPTPASLGDMQTADGT